MTRDEIWAQAAQVVVSAGLIPIVISKTMIELLQEIMTDEQAEFVRLFDKPSLNIDQLKEKSNQGESDLQKMLDSLMHAGVIVGLPSRRTGIMVYRLLGPFPGLFEYTNLRGETGEKQKKLARLFENLFDEMRNFTQDNYDAYIDQAKNFPPVVRVVPIEEEIQEAMGDKIMPTEEVSRIIDKFDEIAVAHCYCRHSKDLVDESCSVTDERLNCLLLGKSARFASDYKFAKLISKDEAKRILVKSADEGLVHKSFHIHLDTERDEEAICNCCKCCCGPFQMYYRGVSPYHCYTNFLAVVDDDKCTLCETCIEVCPMETMEIEDDRVIAKEAKCIGCGVCAHQCPDDAIDMKRMETRQVFVPPPRINA